MRIKAADKRRSVWKKINSLIGRKHRVRKLLLSTLGILLTLVIILFVFYCGIVFHKMGMAHFFNQARLRPNIILNYFKGLTATPERIIIDIKYEDFQKLAYIRETALAKGILVSTPDDYVPARIRYEDRTIRAKLRLKGDVVDQLQGQKWPFRIVIKGEDTLFGMKVFSIHTPKERNFFYEYLLHRAMKREGVISLRYDFIDVTINGKHLGIYALEEHFEKRVIEDNQRREGPILCFNENAETKSVAHSYLWSAKGYWDQKNLDFYKANVDLYRPTKTLADPELRKQFMLAKDLLESFQAGRLKTSDVFDCEILARYLALLDLFNAHHSSRVGNLKFYYNPITSKLEPICFDAEIRDGKDVACEEIYAEDWYEDFRYLSAVFFRDEQLFKLYIQELVRISEPSYLDNLFDEIDDEESKRRLYTIYSEYPLFSLNKKLFYIKQLYIKKVLSLPVTINAYFIRYLEENGEKILELDVDNFRHVPIKIISVNLPSGISFCTKVTERIIQPSLPEQPIHVEKVKFVLPQDFEWKEEYVDGLEVNHTLLGLNTPRKEKVIPWSHFDSDFIESDFIRQASNIRNFDFLTIDDTAKKIHIKPGNWNLDKNLIIPEGYRVVCRESTRLNLSNSAKILSYSSFDFIGLEGDPIIICSEDSTGQGVVVINTGQKTVLRHVIFDNLSNPSHERWSLSGALTFYESPVEIYHCQFSNNRSEDALNILRSDFSIDKTLFNKAYSDAIDIDFGKGQIKDTSFVESGNDAIDVSGSAVELQDVFINGTGDKGLSVGEDSNMTVNTIEIRNAELAMASKDASGLTVNEAIISDSKIGLACYQKKSEFGPSSITITKLTIDKVDIPYLVEEGSDLEIEGQKINPDQKEVKEILNKYIKI